MHTKCRYRWHEKSVTGCLVKKYMVYPLMHGKSAKLDILFLATSSISSHSRSNAVEQNAVAMRLCRLPTIHV